MEDTARVVRLGVPAEISESRIELCEVMRRPEDFCPVRPSVGRAEARLRSGYHRSDACRIRLPG